MNSELEDVKPNLNHLNNFENEVSRNITQVHPSQKTCSKSADDEKLIAILKRLSPRECPTCHQGFTASVFHHHVLNCQGGICNSVNCDVCGKTYRKRVRYFVWK
ncbi:hypothetical protein X975_13291, partial [Stegodyphus mimosarum]